MTGSPPEVLRVDVGETELGVVRWNGAPGAPVVFAVHSLSANSWAWSAVARHLQGRASLVAIDLRGRGFSHDAPGPYGIGRHADDVAAVIGRMNAAPAVVTGHAMGAFVALSVAERQPESVDTIVLVDGGAPLRRPDGFSNDDALEALFGPSLSRLDRIFPDRVTYHSMWTRHPAFAEMWSPEIERYVLSDLIECDGGFRSSVNEDAVRVDGSELLSDIELRVLLARRTTATTIVRADNGALATPPPIIANDIVAEYPWHDWRTVANTNHYSVLMGDVGAAAVAEALLDAVN